MIQRRFLINWLIHLPQLSEFTWRRTKRANPTMDLESWAIKRDQHSLQAIEVAWFLVQVSAGEHCCVRILRQLTNVLYMGS